MRILVVGGGGREHALCWKIGQSPLCAALYCAPGNAGIALERDVAVTCVPIAADDLDALEAFAVREAIDLVVVGPEGPLVGGLVDRLTAHGIRAFGPSAAAARLEGSKAFTKALCARAGIPTAAYATFTDAEAAKAHVRARGAPIVVKADGLAAGKGVTVAPDIATAEAAIDDALVSGAFGAAGASVVIEACLTGPEVSVFALCDGVRAVPLAAAHDYKRAFDGDRGPNTGGMGAVSPTPRLAALGPGDAGLDRAMREIVQPAVDAMAAAGTPFRGVLYAGLMLTPEGPQLIEFNVRFGDPECQALMRRLDSDLVPALAAAAAGDVSGVTLAWDPRPCVCVVVAAEGYPGAYAKGGLIDGLDAAEAVEGVKVFHAGTRLGAHDTVLASGGRVLAATAVCNDMASSRRSAYESIGKIDFGDGFWRGDVGDWGTA